MNAPNAPTDDPQHDENAMPPPQQPQYWTTFLSMEQERHNQLVQWEQHMANQFDAFGTAQNALIQQYGEFYVDTERYREQVTNRIEQIEH
ncbi:hypothetical protein ACSBR1_029503 [Camellia fascicularis]